MRKIYIAGRITGEDRYAEIFKKEEDRLVAEGHKVMNPAILPAGFSYEEYMQVCFAMINVCDEVHFLPNWTQSPGAIRERSYASATGKAVYYIGL